MVMNVLWVSHFLLFPESGFGALQRSRNLLIELSKRHRVTLLSYYRDVDLQATTDVDMARLDLERVCDHVELIYLPFSQSQKVKTGIQSVLFGRPHSVALYRTAHLMQRAKELVRTRSIDVLHVDTLGLMDDVVERLPVRLKTLTHHNVESHMMGRRAEKESDPFKRWAYAHETNKLRRYEHRICPRYDLNVMVSELDEISLRRHTPRVQSVVIPNGVDCRYFSFVERTLESKSLIFAGGLDWYPNADAVRFMCLEIWPALRQRFPNLTLDIIGRNASHDLTRLTQTTPGVRLHGYVPDVRPYVRRANIFVCPIRDGGGTRLKILDAMAQGIPIVATTMACEGLGMKHGEQVLYADTAQEYVMMIDRLLSDQALCSHLSRTARRFVEEHYSFTKVGEKLSETYQQALWAKKG